MINGVYSDNRDRIQERENYSKIMKDQEQKQNHEMREAMVRQYLTSEEKFRRA